MHLCVCVFLPTCWFHRRPALSSRWRQKDWQSRVFEELSSCISAHPSAGRFELSSDLVWPFEHLRRSKEQKHTSYSDMTEQRVNGNAHRSLTSVRASSCFVHEMSSNSKVTVTMIKTVAESYSRWFMIILERKIHHSLQSISHSCKTQLRQICPQMSPAKLISQDNK